MTRVDSTRLTQAAEKLRQLANEALTEVPPEWTWENEWAGGYDETADLTFICRFSPVVALALADTMTEIATEHQDKGRGYCAACGDSTVPCLDITRWDAVCDLVLGGPVDGGTE